MDLNQPALFLPYLEIEVPLLQDGIGKHFVEAAPLSRLLGLDHRREMQRLQHMMLRYQMKCFTLPYGTHFRRAWALPYPLGLVGWLGQAYERVTEPEWKKKLDPFIDWGMDLWGQAFNLTQQRFVQTRKTMYRLASLLDESNAQMQNIHDMAPRFSPDQQAHILQVDVQWQPLFAQASTFVHAWIAAKNALPVVDSIVVKDGSIDPDSPSMTLLATASEADIATMESHMTAFTQWMGQLKVLLADLHQ